MKKPLLTAFIAIGMGIITSLQLVGADPLGVLFLKRVDTNIDGTRVNQGQNTLLEFDIINGYETDAIVSGIDPASVGNNVTVNGVTFSGSGFSFNDDITSLLIGAGETKRVQVDFDLANSEEIGDIQLLIDGMNLVSGSGVYLDSGSELSVDNPLESAMFNIFPDSFGIKDQEELLTPQTYTEDISLPIDFTREEYQLPAQITLEPAIAIPGVTDGLRVVIPGGTIITGSGSGVWAGEIEAPEVLGLPISTNLPAGMNVQKRISVGSSNRALELSLPVTMSIPATGSGLRYVYSSQNGTNWVYETQCTISGGVCSFTISHFTEFLLANPGNGDTMIGGASIGHSGGGGQNTMRHGAYDPNRRGQAIGVQPQVKTTIYNRSRRTLNKYIPCEIDEEAILTNRFYNLKLSQGAPRACREDIGQYHDVPYKIGK